MRRSSQVTEQGEPPPPSSRVRARTLNVARITKRQLEEGRALYPVEEHASTPRPRTRSECIDGPRPCPFVSCAHHLYLDVSARSGSVKLNFPELEPDELPASCALDVAAAGSSSTEKIGEVMNMTGTRVRQVLARAMAKVEAEVHARGLRDLVDGRGGRRLSLRVIVDED